MAPGPRPPAVLGCGLDYNLISHRPVTRACATSAAANSSRREDDTPEALTARLRDYHEKTDPVLDLFRRKEYVIDVDARPDKETVQREIRMKLGLPFEGDAVTVATTETQAASAASAQRSAGA